MTNIVIATTTVCHTGDRPFLHLPGAAGTDKIGHHQKHYPKMPDSCPSIFLERNESSISCYECGSVELVAAKVEATDQMTVIKYCWVLSKSLIDIDAIAK
jgi:hypothetical protein